MSSHIVEHTLVILLEYISGGTDFQAGRLFSLLFEYSFLNKDQKGYEVGKL